ncbi:Uncharacterized protein DAT39_021372, partial [Clarias magur]
DTRAPRDVENSDTNSSGQEPREERESAGVEETTVHQAETEDEPMNEMEQDDAAGAKINENTPDEGLEQARQVTERERGE